MGAGGARARLTTLACAIGAVGCTFGVPAAASAVVTHPFRPKQSASYLAAKRQAQAGAGLGRPLGALMTPAAPAAGGPKAVVAPSSLNQPGLSATDNAMPRNDGTPPDPTGAVGPSHYVEFVNSVVRVYSKADLTTVTGTADLDTFVGHTNDAVFDPQIQYDPAAGRWFYLADDCSIATGAAACTAGNYLAYGWSKTSDPSDLVNGWCRFRTQTDTGSAGVAGYFDDYPKLGHNDRHLVFGTNVFNNAQPQTPFVSARIWSVPKPPGGPLTSCTAGTAHWFSGPASSPTKDANIAGSRLRTSDGALAFTPVPANTQDASPNAYVVAAGDPSPATTNHIMAWHLSGVPGAEALVADGNIGVSGFAVPASVPQPGSSDVLDSSDTRLTQAVAHRDPDAGAEAVWTQHTIDSPGGRSVVRWYELLPATGIRRQEGTVSDPSSFVFNGAISPTMTGNEAVIQYNVGGSTQLAQIRASSRTSALPLDSMTGEVLLGTSSAADQDFSCPSGPPSTAGPSCRWGDYAGATPDPCNPELVWGTNQLIGSASGSSPRWTTRNFALIAGAGPATDPVACLAVSPNPAFTKKAVYFDASGSTGTVTKYEWDLDGNGTFETDTATVDHTSRTYSQPGTFNVQLRVTEGGTTYTTTKSLSIKSGVPSAGFTVPATVGRGQPVTLDGSASTDAEAVGGIQSYSWDFDGDGVTDQTTAGPVVTHTYTTLGTFKPRLVVTDSDDQDQSTPAVQTVTVQNVAPIAQISLSSSTPQTGQLVSFSAAGASDPDGTIVDYRWDLDGDGVFETDTGNRPDVSRSYATPRSFPVAVQVQDNDGVTAVASATLNVTAAPLAPPATPSQLKLVLKLSRNARLATVLKSGLAGSVTCGHPCVVRLTLLITRKSARQMKTQPVIGTSSVVVGGSGAKAVRIRLTRSARKQLRSARSLAVTVTAAATDSARQSARASATVHVRR